MEKIEFIEVNGSELPLSFFPAEIKQLVSTIEIIRVEYNKSAVTTQALSEYLTRLSQQVQGLAEQHVGAALAGQQTQSQPLPVPLPVLEDTPETGGQAE